MRFQISHTTSHKKTLHFYGPIDKLKFEFMSSRKNTVYFVSDAHFGLYPVAEERPREEAFLQFLEFVGKTGESLILLGDLFDFWYEYRSVIPRRYIRILSALERLKQQGMDIHFLVGNHDFWVESFFQNELGISVHKEPWETSFHGKQFFIFHGDGIARKDRGYRMLKKVLRNPVSVFFYRLLHPDLAFAMAGFFSRLSRNHTLESKEQMEILEKDYLEYAEKKFEQGYDCVVLGHTHRPLEMHTNKRTYINTGDWMVHFTYGKLKDGHLSLEYWPKAY